MRLLIWVAILVLLLAGCGENDDRGTIIGTVIDTDTILPLPNARVTVGKIADVTPMDGTYRLDNVPAGDHTIITQLAGYETDSQVIYIPENSVATLDIQLTRIGDIQPSGILLREGSQKIDIGTGPNPQISWSGGGVSSLHVYRWDRTKEIWFVVWGILGPRERNTLFLNEISSPVTYGTIPPNAQDSRSPEPVNGFVVGGDISLTDWSFEIFKPYEKYKIELNIVRRDLGISILYFIR